MEYHFSEIEKKWQQNWESQKVYKVTADAGKKSFYVLDMFPYPSGAGLHVGHPLGYIASDIFSRYKRLKGFNVLHPMGFDSFGLPAEQYAIETGQHPATTTRINIETFKKQLGKIGFCYDWSREVQTSDPNYYQWTQWVFLQLFNSWYNTSANKAEPIETLIKKFTESGSSEFTASEWMNFPETKKQEILMNYRLAFSSYGEVNWCEALGTVLANDEVINGFSERGGHPVVKKKMRQWYLRITAYANRLLEGLNRVDFSDSMKEMQKNWIGRSEGAELDFQIEGQQEKIKVYTTRPDTIFGVDFLVMAPEHELVANITSIAETTNVEEYLQYVKSRSDRERMVEVKQVSGCFTGAYALHPFTGEKIPVYIAEYVLAGYGTGAIMAVPCGDQRDYAFARHFNLPITNIIGSAYDGTEANPTKDAILENSGFLNGLPMKEAMAVALDKIESMGLGTRKVNFRMRDAGFSRQRYWGEPFPIQWIDGIPVSLKENDLPLLLPFVEKYGAGPEGEGPLANLQEWTASHYETSTMPGYAGSSWYFLRYMDPHNRSVFCSREASDYWGQVDVYIGGTEHAVGHLLYSRMWTKVLFDLGYIGFDEPYKKLVNQGMIQGSSRFVYRIKGTNQFVSLAKKDDYETAQLHVDVNFVDGQILNIEAFKNWKPEYATATFILEDGKRWEDGLVNQGNYVCGIETEKMSKSKYNTVNPDVLVEKYGADTFRMYEMFLGPVEASKPWDTKGIEGVHRFLRKLWRLFNDEVNGKVWTDEPSTAAELKVLHRSIQKIESDTEQFSFNTAVSAFMVCVNELTDLKCNKKEVLEKLLILLTPYAPHISEELWHQLGHKSTVLDASYPEWDEKYLVETAKEYPVSINGKLRTTILMDLNLGQEDAEKLVLLNETVQKWLEGKAPKKIIFIKGKMVNVVI
ncbi:MAG: leucine--tRNA ligase [Sphingobacteriales bacterium]|nr:leucine--tRNA ligase [Sphingobacteriales bacterium]